jgi:CDP-diacylglycerol--glycerol-3-phosphate 3-phosphatidyltransferase
MPSNVFFSLPNMMSMSRLVLAAAFVALPSSTARLFLILAASLTDYLDGWLARRHHTQTKWGALLDPLADRMFVFTAVCVFLFGGMITTTEYFVLISRDLATAVGFLVARSVPALRPAIFRARLAGKIVTVLQLMTLIAVLRLPDLVSRFIPVVAVASAWSIADYTLALWRQRRTT